MLDHDCQRIQDNSDGGTRPSSLRARWTSRLATKLCELYSRKQDHGSGFPLCGILIFAIIDNVLRLEVTVAAVNLSFPTIRRHFEARISHTAGLIQAPGVLVKAGTMRPQQQTFVKNAVWEPGTQRGSGGIQAAHIVAGGLYVVHRSGDRRFGSLFYVKATQRINMDT
jgi:hypothetical protein